jgi:multidrug efflux pump subunit AcrB
MVQLRSVKLSVMMVITGPLGLIGAAWTLILLGQPLGFVAFLGVIAMSGMIIRNSVILVDQIDKDIQRGMSAFDAVVAAAVRRARPIFLTTITAVLAMIPLTTTSFWGPMAVSIMGGLIVATALTLLSLPALYAAVYRINRNVP